MISSTGEEVVADSVFDADEQDSFWLERAMQLLQKSKLNDIGRGTRVPLSDPLENPVEHDEIEAVLAYREFRGAGLHELNIRKSLLLHADAGELDSMRDRLQRIDFGARDSQGVRDRAVSGADIEGHSP